MADSKLMDAMAKPARSAPSGAWLQRVDDFVRQYKLSPKERELLVAVIQGKGLDACASEVGCAVGTVKTHWARIFSKTRMRSRRDVIAGVLRCPE